MVYRSLWLISCDHLFLLRHFKNVCNLLSNSELCCIVSSTPETQGDLANPTFFFFSINLLSHSVDSYCFPLKEKVRTSHLGYFYYCVTLVALLVLLLFFLFSKESCFPMDSSQIRKEAFFPSVKPTSILIVKG